MELFLLITIQLFLLLVQRIRIPIMLSDQSQDFLTIPEGRNLYCPELSGMTKLPNPFCLSYTTTHYFSKRFLMGRFFDTNIGVISLFNISMVIITVSLCQTVMI